VPVGTREAILDAALELIQTVGANAMSYQDLADRVGVRKPSIHHHFPTKADLIEAVIEFYSEDFLGKVRRIAESGETGERRLRAYAGLFEATLRGGGRGRACACGMLGTEIATLTPGAAARLEAFIAANERLIAGMLEAGERDGSLRAMAPGQRADAAAEVFAALEGGLLLARVSGGTRYFKRIVERLIGPLRV
jgi:TetR/AcrR family transcriptional repressor of nem operon